MPKCVVCEKELSGRWNVLADHKEHRCGACGGMVGTGCFEIVHNELGEDMILCQLCKVSGKTPNKSKNNSWFGVSAKAEAYREETLAQLHETGQALINEAHDKLKTTSVELLEEVHEKLKGTSNELISDAERRVQKKIEHLEQETYPKIADDIERRLDARLKTYEQLLQKRAKEEVRAATVLFAIMAGAVFVTGLISLLIAYLHRSVL